ncbi:hypothetical protein Ahy_B08g093514 [Arachis hypogaea]|uniref:Pentatricopeptide repeat-containing protein n=1 Tax=Arachis hypogaea TaxID=3818 RepID=A0A444Y695_ARAHY|nr:hypothetical protein Ahy_B08g093514 [Arachis hypogaea]
MMLFRSICKLFNTSRLSAYQLYSTKSLISSFHSFDELEAKIVQDNRDPTTPVTPILNQWVQDGGSITHEKIRYLIACLCRRRCYTHALEVLFLFYDIVKLIQWYPFIVSSKTLNAAEHKSLEKVEAPMKKIREIYPMSSPMCYNKMLKLYAELGKYEKLDSLMQEMMEKDLREPVGVPTQKNGYLKGGNVEKALSALKKSEQLALGNPVACLSILTIYAGIGNKAKVYGIWGKCKLRKRFYNQGHLLMLSSLVKLGDIFGAEKIMEEWESNYKVFDTRIPHLMIHSYCKLGMLDKAEACIKRLLDSGKQLQASTWESLAEHYCADNNMEKAVQAMKDYS